MTRLTVDGVDMKTLAKNVETLGATLRKPARRGSNALTAGRSGVIRTPDKLHEAPTYTWPMWVVGCKDDGSIPTTEAQVFRDNIDSLTALFDKDGVLDVRHWQPGSLEEDVVNLVTNPSGRNVSGTIVVRENLVPNPSLGNDATGWVPYGAPTYGPSTDEAHSGVRSYRVVTDDSTIAQGAWVVVNRPGSGGWDVGDTVNASIWVKAPAGTPLVFGLRAPTNLGAGLAPMPFVATGDWQMVSTSYTVALSVEVDDVATDLAYLNPQVTTRSPLPAVGTTFYLDDALLEINTSGATFDGSTAAAGDFTYAWSGTPNASTSRQLAPSPVGIVKINNSSVVWSGADDSLHALSKKASAAVGFSTVTKMPVETGTLTLLATVESSGAVTLGAWGYDGNDAFVSLPYTSVTGPGTFRVVIDLPGQVETVRMVLTGHSISTSNLGEEIKFRDLLMVDGDYAGSFFDGNSGPGSTWDGTPDASTSTKHADVRQADCECLTAIDFSTLGVSSIGKFSVELQNLNAYWADLYDTTTHLPPDEHEMPEFGGSTAPFDDGTVTITGPATNPRVTDWNKGSYVQYNGVVAEGQTLVIDAANLQISGTGGLEPSLSDLQIVGMAGRMFRLIPDPINRGYAAQLSASATSSTTSLTIQGRRKYLVG